MLKRKSRMPCTQLTLEYLRKQGMFADVVERRIPMKPFPITKDLFGCFDIFAVDPERKENLFVQTTSFANRSSRRKKLEESEAARIIHALTSIGPNRIQIVTWKKQGHEYICHVEEAKIEYGPDQMDHVRLLAIWFPTMKQVREDWRKENPAGNGRESKSRSSGDAS